MNPYLYIYQVGQLIKRMTFKYVKLKLPFTLVIFILFIFSCKKNEEGTSEDTDIILTPVSIDFKDIYQRGELRAAVDYSATTYFLYKGQPLGFEYELLTRYARSMKVKLKIIIQPSIKEAFAMLQRGEVDVVAYPLAITLQRKQLVNFTDRYTTVRQMLVQRKPEGWTGMNPYQLDKVLVRNQVDLLGKKVHVLNNSSYITSLKSLEKQIGGEILIVEDSASVESDELIKRVANGTYDYTVADENIAQVNATYYPNLDVETPVSFPTRIAWAVRKTSPILLDSLNHNIEKVKKSGMLNFLYRKYYESSRNVRLVANEEYTSLGSNPSLSPYDDLIKQNAKKLNWDWLMLASMVMQESKFNPRATSWVGAQGLLQLMPSTARHYGITRRTDPEQSLNGGTDYLLNLEKRWQENMEDQTDLVEFVLASYNVGIGHIIDARALVTKYGGNRDSWEEVSRYLKFLSKKKYYTDPVVKLGYCRGEEPVNYVEQIKNRYAIYKDLLKEA